MILLPEKRVVSLVPSSGRVQFYVARSLSRLIDNEALAACTTPEAAMAAARLLKALPFEVHFDGTYATAQIILP